MASDGNIHPILVPKWGLTMEEGMLVTWHVAEGSNVATGDELLEIETSKIANGLEATHAGILRRQIGKAGQVYPCGALIGVIAEAEVPEEMISAFVAEHAQATRPVGSAQGPEPQLLNVHGCALRFLKLGQGGVPILLLHGLAGDLNNWMLVQPPLAEKHATYAVDLPGHGASSKDLSGITGLSDVAGLLVAFLDELAINDVHLVAHSMGAAIALAIARQHDKRVKSLTLLSPTGLGIAPAPDFLEGLVTARSRREMTTVLRMLLADEKRLSRDMVNDMLKYKRLDGAEAALKQFAAFLSAECRAASESFAGVTSSVHVICGAKDHILRPLTASELPHTVRLTVIEDAAHMPHLERSAQVVEAIEDSVSR